MSDLESLSAQILEFYEKLSSWEHAVARDSPLTLPQTHVLEVLGQHPPLRMKELAAKMGVTTGTLTVVVDRLERLDMVARTPNEADRRSVLVTLTERGRALFEEHHKHHLDLARDLFAALSEDETRVFAGILRKLNMAF
ncbi:HTH-type transcriptional regulator MgrA [Fundidesulfovibrio magnetotacticus]|uniref:HTH-type transcriptional regulator MgrA n=1 Tax=Fundidesulfovibrio magnetotacticus TaxID=2730080 RepID=A0A6V8LYW6_9BACT|nr:MarR family transcriptional regulator [Fundidesulfovibrio magnetotacticus]GFK95199.1 HTH-type transcriptional regulator MgrA [Fundidesulfovibrio magnetotacticus]